MDPPQRRYVPQLRVPAEGDDLGVHVAPIHVFPSSATSSRAASSYRAATSRACADGTYGRLLGKLARMDVLLLDDWGLAPPQDQERRDLLEILEDRYGSRSTIVTSQLPPAQWHDHIGEPTLADAICDRLLHNAHRIVLKGPSRRKEGKLDS